MIFSLGRKLYGLKNRHGCKNAMNGDFPKIPMNRIFTRGAFPLTSNIFTLFWLGKEGWVPARAIFERAQADWRGRVNVEKGQTKMLGSLVDYKSGLLYGK